MGCSGCTGHIIIMANKGQKWTEWPGQVPRPNAYPPPKFQASPRHVCIISNATSALHYCANCVLFFCHVATASLLHQRPTARSYCNQPFMYCKCVLFLCISEHNVSFQSVKYTKWDILIWSYLKEYQFDIEDLYPFHGHPIVYFSGSDRYVCIFSQWVTV